MSPTQSGTARRRIGSAAATLGAAGAITALGISAAGASSPAPGAQATTRAAGTCAGGTYNNPGFLASNAAKQQTLVAGNEITEPEFSLDGRANRRLAFVSTGNVAGFVQPGTRNVYVVSRTGTISSSGNAWQKGATVLVSQGPGTPANGNSWGPSLSGRVGAGERGIAPSKMAFLSDATNLAGGNPTGVSAYSANAGGGGIRRLNVPGRATGVGVSGDSKIYYVTTDSGIYVVKGSGKGRKLASGAGMSTPTTTFNGKQAAYGQNGRIFTITQTGKRRQVAVGSDPQADGGFPRGAKLGLVRAVSFQRGGTAYKVGIIAGGAAKGVKSFGRTDTPTSLNGGGSAVAFGSGIFACLQVQVVETGKRGGYAIPQGQCPRGTVTDVGVSTRYNYLAFTCSGGGLYLYYVGGK